MLTMDDTEGYSRAELDLMNDEAKRLLAPFAPEMDDLEYRDALRYEEENVLRRYDSGELS